MTAAPSRQYRFDERRRAAGWRRVPVWMDPETQAALARLVDELAVSEQEAVRSAIIATAASIDLVDTGEA